MCKTRRLLTISLYHKNSGVHIQHRLFESVRIPVGVKYLNLCCTTQWSSYMPHPAWPSEIDQHQVFSATGNLVLVHKLLSSYVQSAGLRWSLEKYNWWSREKLDLASLSPSLPSVQLSLQPIDKPLPLSKNHTRNKRKPSHRNPSNLIPVQRLLPPRKSQINPPTNRRALLQFPPLSASFNSIVASTISKCSTPRSGSHHHRDGNTIRTFCVSRNDANIGSRAILIRA